MITSYSEFAYLSVRRELPDASLETQSNGNARMNMNESPTNRLPCTHLNRGLPISRNGPDRANFFFGRTFDFVSGKSINYACAVTNDTPIMCTVLLVGVFSADGI